MFGLFKKAKIEHPVFGTLTKRGDVWVGNIELLTKQFIPLEMDGTKEGPLPEVLDSAEQLRKQLPTLKPSISSALLDHLEPYRDALKDPDEDYTEMLENPEYAARIGAISTPDDAWDASRIVGFEIGKEGRSVRLLIMIETIWDSEHTLGAYFDDWKFMELNGSV